MISINRIIIIDEIDSHLPTMDGLAMTTNTGFQLLYQVRIHREQDKLRWNDKYDALYLYTCSGDWHVSFHKEQGDGRIPRND
jgi:hypothetical protein